MLADVIIDLLAPLVSDVLAGRADSPPPIMPWLKSLTLGGRLKTTAVVSTAKIGN